MGISVATGLLESTARQKEKLAFFLFGSSRTAIVNKRWAGREKAGKHCSKRYPCRKIVGDKVPIVT